jgi:hypothetical protein
MRIWAQVKFVGEEGSAKDAAVDLASLENLQSINEEYPQDSTFQSPKGGLVM